MTTTYRRPAAIAFLALAAGIGASLAGNLQAINLDNATPGIGAYISAIFWPLALFLVIEILIHTPWLANWRDAWTKLVAIGLVGFVAAWVSYWHLANVLDAYGYDAVASHLGPLAIDGMMGMATLALNRVGQARRAPVDMELTQDYVQDIPLEDATELATAQAGQELVEETEGWLARLSSEIDSTTTPAVPVIAVQVPSRTRTARRTVEPELTELLTAWDFAGRPMPKGEVDEILAAHFDVSTRTIRRRREALGLV